MFTIRDIKKNDEDSSGTFILTVYAKVENAYAIYRTSERVLVQFSDDNALGADQRKLMAPLGPARGEINGLIDGWRNASATPPKGLRKWFRMALGWLFPDSDHDREAKAALFDRRVADALAIALQGGAAEAATLLDAIKADVLEERNSVARSEYLLVAGLLFAVVIGVIAAVTAMAHPDVTPIKGTDGTTPLPDKIGANAIGFAAGFGALGALFSIAIALRSRELRTDLQSVDNIIDAAMRILIGAVSAIILYCLLAAGYFSFGFGSSGTLQFAAWQPGLAVMAFVAGFSERLVGDALQRATLGAASAVSANPLAGSAAASAGATQSAVANERNPLGRVAAGSAAPPAGGGGIDAVNDDEETAEGGHDHTELAESELTSDVELPEAVGGVERTN